MLTITSHQRNAKETTVICGIPNIKNSDNTRKYRECRESSTSTHCGQECKMVWPLWRSLAVSYTTKIARFLHDPAVALWHYPRKMKTCIQRKKLLCECTQQLICNRPNSKQHYALIGESFNKLEYPHHRILLSNEGDGFPENRAESQSHRPFM